MTSIITVMKLGRDSESGVYRTFHNPTMSPKRSGQAKRRPRKKERMFDRQTVSLGSRRTEKMGLNDEIRSSNGRERRMKGEDWNVRRGETEVAQFQFGYKVLQNYLWAC